jgi:hypothetical protein
MTERTWTYSFRRIAGLLLVTALVAGSEVRAAKSRLAWERFQHAAWSTVRSLQAVSPQVLEGLRSRLEDPRIADVGEPFDATDIRTGLPIRRLVLAGHAALDCFIVYEQGGRGHHLVFVDFEMAPRLRPVLLATGTAGVHDDVKGWQLDVPALAHGLEAGSMQWGDPDASRY